MAPSETGASRDIIGTLDWINMSHSLFGESRGCGKLLDGGVATQPTHESSARRIDAAERLVDMDR